MSSASKGGSLVLARLYSAALRAHLARRAGTRSRSAGRVGRQALAAGLDTLELVSLHERALIALLKEGPSSRDSARTITRAGNFLCQALAPFEIARRSAIQGHGQLTRLNGIMRLRTATTAATLAATRRHLQREVRRRRNAEHALRESKQHYSGLLKRSHRMRQHLRSLSHEILSEREKERMRISRELHDEIGQTLTAINVKLAMLQKQATVDTSGLSKTITSTQRLVERSMTTVHRFARDLRPPQLDDLGLLPTFRSLLRDFSDRNGITVHFRGVTAVERLRAESRIVLYRVAQEALTNIVKHAQATMVHVSLRSSEGFVRLEIHDNGKSFPVEKVLSAARVTRLGLIGMRERVEMVGGTFYVESAPDEGTTIRADVPHVRRRKPSLPLK